jgi:hypothetical protein
MMTQRDTFLVLLVKGLVGLPQQRRDHRLTPRPAGADPLRNHHELKHEQAMNHSRNKADTLRVLPIMNRYDVLVWLSLSSFVALCGAAIWVLSWPASTVFG